MSIFDNIFQVLMTGLAFLFLAAAFVTLWEGKKLVAAMMAATSFSIAASVSLAIQWGIVA
jgi:hypothetical protein